ncbi:MAG: ABC transporter ATP-binding protein [Lachnospiraceae bacterium]|nr:ABC transporter ATP-binding protein [Lachnospiraceae bacterium]
MRILETKGLCKSYGSNSVLSDVDLRIDNGEFIAVMGQSGCGKSTLLYCISGMDKPSAGRICFDGVDMSDLTDKQMQELRLERMGFVFQKTSFLKNLSIIDNIVYPAFQLGRIKRSEIIREALSFMEEMGISSIAENDIHKVSGGQLQRAAICRAMINHPDILFGDELTGALNSSTTRDVLSIIDNINKKGTTVLLVTHDANVAVHADKVIYLEDGRIMDTLNLGKYDRNNSEVRDVRMKNWLEKMKF